MQGVYYLTVSLALAACCTTECFKFFQVKEQCLNCDPDSPGYGNILMGQQFVVTGCLLMTTKAQAFLISNPMLRVDD